MVVYQVSSERTYTAEAYILPSSINSFLFAIVTVIVLSLIASSVSWRACATARKPKPGSQIPLSTFPAPAGALTWQIAVFLGVLSPRILGLAKPLHLDPKLQ